MAAQPMAPGNREHDGRGLRLLLGQTHARPQHRHGDDAFHGADARATARQERVALDRFTGTDSGAGGDRVGGLAGDQCGGGPCGQSAFSAKGRPRADKHGDPQDHGHTKYPARRPPQRSDGAGRRVRVLMRLPVVCSLARGIGQKQADRYAEK